MSIKPSKTTKSRSGSRELTTVPTQINDTVICSRVSYSYYYDRWATHLDALRLTVTYITRWDEAQRKTLRETVLIGSIERTSDRSASLKNDLAWAPARLRGPEYTKLMDMFNADLQKLYPTANIVF